MRRLLAPLALLLAVLLAAPAAALAQAEATPVRGPAVALDVAVDPALLPPGGATIVTLERLPLAAGATEAVEGYERLEVLLVEAGAVEARLAGPATLVAPGGAEQPVPAGMVPLPAGAALLVPPGTGYELANPGTGPAGVLSLLLYPPGGGHPTEPEAPEGAGMSGQTTWRLLALGEVVAPFVPARVRVETVSAAAGATLEGMDVAGVAIAAVERGALAAAVERGFAQATSARVLATGAYGPGAASVGPGQRRLVREGGSLFVHPGSAVALAADPDGPLALLVVRLEPGPAATPVP